MVVTQNRHGLSRTIPDDVKRDVRQRCGFGCVVCGNAFIQYDHLDPPFVKARQHIADGIVLLCGGCHDRKTRGALSEASVRAAAINPAARRRDFSFGPLDIGHEHPIVAIGDVTCTRVDTVVMIDLEPILQIQAPEFVGGPFRISARMTDRTGAEILRIVDNEWRARPQNWDVEVEGSRLTIRRGPRDIALKLRSEPPRRLVVERMKMTHRGAEISVVEGRHVRFRSAGGAVFETEGAITDIRDSEVAIEFNSTLGSVAIGMGGHVRIMLGGGSGAQMRSRGPSVVPRQVPGHMAFHGLPFVGAMRCWCGKRIAFSDCCMPKLLRKQ